MLNDNWNGDGTGGGQQEIDYGPDDIQPDPDELAGGRFWSPDEIEQAIGRGVLTPNFEQEYTRIKDALTALL